MLLAGAGLLLHYINTGKSTDEILHIVRKFCESLQIQTPRVCEGITNGFGVSSNDSPDLLFNYQYN